MSEVISHPLPRPRNSEDKLFEACLNACIEGIQSFQVDKRQGSCGMCKFHSPETRLPVTDIGPSATRAPNNNTRTGVLDSTTKLAVTSLNKRVPAACLPSPPPSPPSFCIFQPTSLFSHSLTSTTTMNRSVLYGAPVWGPPPSRWGNQDERSNLAIQPDTNSSHVKLKRNAVKLVGAAASTSSASPRSTAPASPIVSSPIPGPVRAQPTKIDGYVVLLIVCFGC